MMTKKSTPPSDPNKKAAQPRKKSAGPATPEKKTGRPLNATPDQVWELFKEFVKFKRENPLMIPEQKRGATNLNIPKGTSDDVVLKLMEGQDPIVLMPHRNPITVAGFCQWVDENNDIAIHYYFEEPKKYPAFAGVTSRVRAWVKGDLAEGGLAGQYHANLTARLTDLAEKQDVTSGGEKVQQVTVFRIPDNGRVDKTK